LIITNAINLLHMVTCIAINALLASGSHARHLEHST